MSHSKVPAPLVVDWGLIPYEIAFERQSLLVQEIISGNAPEQIIFCSHPPIVTLGRGTKDGDVFNWSGQSMSVNRGGRATYHGPSQVIMYPLLYIGKPSSDFTVKRIAERDLHAYMRVLENSVIELLKQFDLESTAQSVQLQINASNPKEATGVWVGNKKIAAVGIAVKNWVVSHGVSLNVLEDKKAFSGINPCGFRSDQVTSIEEQIGRVIDRKVIIEKWSKSFRQMIFE